MPISRSVCSGVATMVSPARRAALGNPANRTPSIASTRPSATNRSVTAPGRRAGRRRPADRPARLLEEAEERAVGRQHQPRSSLQRLLVGLHRAEEGEELGVALERLGEDAGLLRLALAAQDLGVAVGLGHDHLRVAVRARADALRLLGAAGADLGRLLGAFATASARTRPWSSAPAGRRGECGRRRSGCRNGRPRGSPGRGCGP